MLNYNIKFSKNLIVSGFVFCFFCLVFIPVYGQNSWDLPLKKCWSINNSVGSKLASDNKSELLISFSSNEIRLINPQNGLVNWVFTIDGKLIDEPFLDKGQILYLSEDIDRKIFLNSLNIKSGLINWKTNIESANQISMQRDMLLVLSISAKKIFNIDLLNGKILSEYNYETDIKMLLDSDKNFLIFPINNNSILFSNSVLDNLPNLNSDFFIAESILYGDFAWADRNNEIGIYSLGIKDNSWTRKLGGRITSIRSFENKLFVTSLDNFVYIFDTDNGNLLLKKRLDGRIIESSYVFNNMIITGAYNSSMVYIFNLKNNQNINLITLSDADFAESFVFSENRLIISTPSKIHAFSPFCK